MNLEGIEAESPMNLLGSSQQTPSSNGQGGWTGHGDAADLHPLPDLREAADSARRSSLVSAFPLERMRRGPRS